MKNKNLFVKIMLCVCLCFPTAFTLSACKNGEHNMSEDWTNNATYHWHKCLDDDCDYTTDKAEHIYDDDNDMSCNTCGYIRQKIQLYKNVTITGVIEDYVLVKKGETAHFELKLSDNYNPDTLKIMNGTTELTWTKANNLTAVTAFEDKDIVVGTLDVTDVQGHLDLVATAEEATIDYVFETSKTTYTDEEQTILSEFTLKDGKTLYEAFTTEGYKYKLSVSEFKNKKIDFTSTYDSEVYNIEGGTSIASYSLVSTSATIEANDNDNDNKKLNIKGNTGSTQIDENDKAISDPGSMKIYPVNTKIQKNTTNKSFSFILGTSEIDNNKIYFINSIGYATVNVKKASGTILNAEVYYSEKNTDSFDYSQSYKFSKNGEIRITINENTNFDLTNIKVWLNKTEMSFHAKDATIDGDKDYYYLEISKEKTPTFYAGEKAEKYEISVTGVTLKDDATDVSTIRLDNETDKNATFDSDHLNWISSDCYYCDNSSAKAYLVKDSEENPTQSIKIFGNITKFSITTGTTTYTIDLNEVFKNTNGYMLDYEGNTSKSIDESIKNTYSSENIENILALGNLDFSLTGNDINKDGKFTFDEIISVDFSLKYSSFENITITILG